MYLGASAGRVGTVGTAGVATSCILEKVADDDANGGKVPENVVLRIEDIELRIFAIVGELHGRSAEPFISVVDIDFNSEM